MTIEIRRLLAGDGAVLERVAEGVFDEPLDPKQIAAYLAAPGHHLIVAIRDGEVVGQVAAVVHRHPDKPTELYIDEVGVAPAHQRQGIAQKMLAAMFAHGRSLGCDQAWVGTENDNVAARRLYESFGVPGEPFVMYLYDL
jgi:ribosomal protein S18 acetylase RimI-like enzyme